MQQNPSRQSYNFSATQRLQVFSDPGFITCPLEPAICPYPQPVEASPSRPHPLYSCKCIHEIFNPALIRQFKYLLGRHAENKKCSVRWRRRIIERAGERRTSWVTREHPRFLQDSRECLYIILLHALLGCDISTTHGSTTFAEICVTTRKTTWPRNSQQQHEAHTRTFVAVIKPSF
jgi:hypothetical protein